MVKEGASWKQRDRLLSCVDQVIVLLTGRWRRSHPQDAVFAVKNDFPVWVQMIGDKRRYANAQIDVCAFRDVSRNALRHFYPCKLFHFCDLISILPPDLQDTTRPAPRVPQRFPGSQWPLDSMCRVELFR